MNITDIQTLANKATRKEPCAICNHGPHPSNQHQYMTWAELEAHTAHEAARHPATGFTETTYINTYRPY